MGRAAREWHHWCFPTSPMERLMPKFDDPGLLAPGQALSRSLVALDQDSTVIAVIELSRSSWLVGGLVPRVEREPMKKLAAEPDALLRVLYRWRDEAAAGHPIARICVCLRGGPRRLLAGALAARSRRRMRCDPSDERVGLARAPAGEDRPARSGSVDTRVSRLAARREAALQHGGGAVARDRRRQTAAARARLPGCRRHPTGQSGQGLLALPGIAKFNVRAKAAPQRLPVLRTAEDEPLPPNTLAELLRGLERLQQIQAQIAAIETAQR